MIILKAQGIRKSYDNLEVLKDIDLEINKGELVSIVGASGAGKSTLLHILGTLDNSDQGSVEIEGNRIDTFSSKELALFRNKHIGFIFQFHNLLPEFSALENVCLPGFLGERNQKEVKIRAEYLLTKLGLEDRLNHKPSEMSGGEQQRTAVARALINQPSIIFADEPSGNLDSKNAEDLHNLFHQLKEEFQQTFVIVTHNEDLANMGDRKLEMLDGQMIN